MMTGKCKVCGEDVEVHQVKPGVNLYIGYCHCERDQGNVNMVIVQPVDYIRVHFGSEKEK